MEEKNKRRKALLAKTIAEKSKQTQAEAIKLKKIQKELQVLDDSVSNDIAIIRKLIEQASMEYSTAWKRLEKAEAEYVAAKLDLHKKAEVKEQLTEHLCTIIQQNELRKACKLEELMLQLQLDAEGEGSPESPAPQVVVETAGGGAIEVSAQPAVVNGGLAGPMGSTDVGEDCATTEPKPSRDQAEESTDQAEESSAQSKS
ncbi:RAB6-interacting golgin isoform X2 [Brachyhypopomus gauderio]